MLEPFDLFVEDTYSSTQYLLELVLDLQEVASELETGLLEQPFATAISLEISSTGELTQAAVESIVTNASGVGEYSFFLASLIFSSNFLNFSS